MTGDPHSLRAGCSEECPPREAGNQWHPGAVSVATPFQLKPDAEGSDDDAPSALPCEKSDDDCHPAFGGRAGRRASRDDERPKPVGAAATTA
jgi:hypothetical protein